MTSFFLKGYWETNLGDDLFVRVLCERYPEHNFYLEANFENARIFESIDNLTVIDSNKNLKSKVIRKLKTWIWGDSAYHSLYKKISNYIEIGGSIFLFTDNNWKNKRILKNRVKTRNLAKNYFVIGSNFGPYYKKSQYDSYKSFFSSITGGVFRDQKSYELFEHLPNIRLAPDVVLNLKVKKDLLKEKHVVVSLIDLENRDLYSRDNQLDYENKILEIVCFYLKQNKKVLLMGFCESEGDSQINDRIFSRIPPSLQDKVIKYTHNSIDTSLEILREAEAILATRFHAMILGWIFKKPMFVISYSNKTLDTIQYLYPKQQYINIKEIKKLEVVETFSNLESIPNEILIEISKQSDRQFSYIDEFVH